ncbi:lipopolysaccharide transport periplasmic protein LptA [Thermovibrio sp.]
MRLIISIILFFCLLTVNSFSSEEKVNSLPVVIEAQKLNYNDKKKIAVYIGNVIAQHGQTILKGDKLTIYFTPDGKEIKKIVVEGNVYLKDPRGEGWCQQLIYYPFQEKVVLIGNAKLKQGKNLIVGDRIIAYKDGRVEVIGIKERVKTIIYTEGKVAAGEGLKPPKGRENK